MFCLLQPLQCLCFIVSKAFAVTMRITKNYRVLRLVHPGGFVEIHQNPITADEVMKKNPRHCVTRPDVFRNPWIVVRPESVLKPGSVFYIVPFHTIHGLMQRNICKFRNYLLQQQDFDSSLLICFDQLQNQCTNTSETRTKIDFKIEKWPEDAVFPECLIRNESIIESGDHQGSLIKSRFELGNFDNSPTIPCLVDHWNTYLVDHWNTTINHENRKEFKQRQSIDSFIEPGASFSFDSFIEPGASFSLDTASINAGEFSNNSQESKSLKSCLKKDNQARSRGFRVKFDLPE